MHILLIHQAFAGPNDPGGTRHFEFARHCVGAGHRVTVIASDLVYMTGTPSDAGEYALPEGLTLIRLRTPRTLHGSVFGRLVAFWAFMLGSALAGLRVRNPDVVMGTSPPMFQAASAWLVSALRRRPFLLEIRDLWPDSLVQGGVLQNRSAIWAFRALEGFLYRRAQRVLGNSPAYRSYLIEQKGVPAERIDIIPNGVDVSLFDPAERSEDLRERWGVANKVLVTYTGALGAANSIPTILRAAARLRDRDDVHFLLAGGGNREREARELSDKLGLTNVTFAGGIAKARIPQLLAASDVCLATLKPNPIYNNVYPNKVFDYMAAGRPTILTIDGVIREVIERSGGGLYVPPADDAALAAAILELCSDRPRRLSMGRSARDYVAKHFDRRSQSQAFLELVKGVAASARSPRIQGPQRRGACYHGTKRALDLLVSTLCLVVFGPLLAAIAVGVWLILGRPVLFRQQRLGLRGRPFTILKFRTMTNQCDGDGNLLPDERRTTRLGLFLRRTSLDELPQLWNVLKGEMSLVGTRPHPLKYLERYSPEQRRRLQVKPGMTTLSAVKGRNAQTWEQKLAWDVYYVDHQSLWLDLAILVRTLVALVTRRGASGDAPMPEFRGSASDGSLSK